MKNYTHVVFLSFFFWLPKNEKHRVSPILNSLKFNSKGPLRLQTRKYHSFLGLDFKLSWTHLKDELLNKKMLSSSSLSKIKRYLPEMVGEKRENRFICYNLICKSITPLLNMTLFVTLLPGFGKSFAYWLIKPYWKSLVDFWVLA